MKHIKTVADLRVGTAIEFALWSLNGVDVDSVCDVSEIYAVEINQKRACTSETPTYLLTSTRLKPTVRPTSMT
jgi:hypothetical protein